MRYQKAADSGILITFGDTINEFTYSRIIQFEQELEKNKIRGVQETNRGFCTLLLSYDFEQITYGQLVKYLRKIEHSLPNETNITVKKEIYKVPIAYESKFGPDLPRISEILDMSEEEIIQRHLSKEHLIYIVGFVCGSAFYKGDDPMFDIPRKKSPVLGFPIGTVLIADGLGNVCKTAQGPTSWYAIGRSPLRQWQPEKDPPVLFRSGDWIKFQRVNEEEFWKIDKEEEKGQYVLTEG